MISKPSIKISLAAFLTACAMLFTQCGTKVADQDGINSFLNLVNLQIKDKQVEALLKNFDMPKRRAAILQLVKVLCNINGMEKGSKPIFKTEIDLPAGEIKPMGDGVTMVTSNVIFSRDSLNSRGSNLLLKIKKDKTGKYKIFEVEAKTFSEEYVAYQNYVHGETLTDVDIYSPQTLAAFKTAEDLKAKYDSIPYFQHIDGKTFFYVVKGKMHDHREFDHGDDTTAIYKIGLVDPTQKEVVPIEYDLIHNIGATFANWIEVEKGDKRGFYDVNGQNILAVEYDEILPIDDDANLAVLRKADDYYWWKKDLTVSDQDPEIRIAELLPKIQAYGKSARINETVMKNLTEFNDREIPESVYFPPSYLVDWNLMPYQQRFKNPLRRNVYYEGATELYELKFKGGKESDSWLSSVFYSITDHYLGGREGLYTDKNVLVTNKNTNRIYGARISADYAWDEGMGGKKNDICDVNSVRPISDTIYEIKAGASFGMQLHDSTTWDFGPGYHYLALRNEKLAELKTERLFAFTKFVKMDDSYLNACYQVNDRSGNLGGSKELLSYMKNEIFGEYHFKFKDPFWSDAFKYQYQYFDKPLFENVDAKLTEIDKYNISFINKKLQQLKPAAKPKVLAAK